MDAAVQPGFHTPFCRCHIVPKKVLARFARDRKLTAAQRRPFANALKLEDQWREVRAAKGLLALKARTFLASALEVDATVAPEIEVFDCRHGTVLPGSRIASPNSSADGAARDAATEAAEVARFLREEFGRNSLDDAGMALLSSVHYSVKYNNAFWNGSQMVYGDGDGAIFVDFTGSNDVIAHEMTHGMTQYSAALGYEDQAGGLNESVSDVFGSMFRQWRAGQAVADADWLIGHDIMGPAAKARGYTCLRDMADPAADHCLSPQPVKFSQYRKGMDPHDSSGIPNLAFCKAAVAIGGNSWKTAGQIWFRALTGYAPSPNLTMKAFANRTRAIAKQQFSSQPNVAAAIDQAWKDVGL